MRTLIVIDMQNDFITGSLGSKEAEAIVPKVVRKISEAEEVRYTLDTHDISYLESQEGRLLPVEHCIRGTKGHELHTEIKKEIKDRKSIPGEYVKYTFGSVDLANDMAHLYQKYQNQRIDLEVELVGLCTDICVVSNALLLKAFVPEMKIYVDSQCCAGTTPEKHEAALKTMESCQIIIE